LGLPERWPVANRLPSGVRSVKYILPGISGSIIAILWAASQWIRRRDIASQIKSLEKRIVKSHKTECNATYSSNFDSFVEKTSGESEYEAWIRLDPENNKEIFNFLKYFLNSMYKNNALNLLETNEWNHVDKGSYISIKSFIERYPRSDYANEAKYYLEKIREISIQKNKILVRGLFNIFLSILIMIIIYYQYIWFRNVGLISLPISLHLIFVALGLILILFLLLVIEHNWREGLNVSVPVVLVFIISHVILSVMISFGNRAIFYIHALLLALIICDINYIKCWIIHTFFQLYLRFFYDYSLATFFLFIYLCL